MAGLYLMAAIVWLAVRPDLKIGESAATPVVEIR
jgi:hypothetical protein